MKRKKNIATLYGGNLKNCPPAKRGKYEVIEKQELFEKNSDFSMAEKIKHRGSFAWN